MTSTSSSATKLAEPIRKPRLALFDLDHTLLPLDSDYEWGQFTNRIGWVDAVEFASRNQDFFEQYKAGTLDLNEYMQFATQAIRAKGPQASHAAHEQFMTEVIEPAILPPALGLLAQHRNAGDEIVIITATNEFITTPIARKLGVSNLLAVQLQKQADGWYSGLIEGVPSAREGKVTRMQQWLAERQLGWQDVHTTFYSDSHNDIPLLEQVDTPVATNPDATLRQHAQQKGWRILDLFQNQASQ